MRGRVVGGVVGAAAATAAVAWWTLRTVLPDVRTGVFPNGMEYMRSGTGSKTLLWLIGSPGRAVPPSRLVQRSASILYRPFHDAGYTVWTVGRRRHLPDGYTIADMADDYARLIEDEFDGMVDVVVGESFGGMIGQYLAASHPDRFRHIALIVAGCELSAWSDEIDRRFIAALSAGDTAAARTISLESVIPETPERTRRLLGALMWRVLGLDEVPARDLIVETEAGLGFDTRPILPQITVPVLVLAGDRDRFFPKAVIEQTAWLIPDCTLIWREGKGHLDAANDARNALDILSFVSGQTSAARRS